jgi:hypothetical protein
MAIFFMVFSIDVRLVKSEVASQSELFMHRQYRRRHRRTFNNTPQPRHSRLMMSSITRPRKFPPVDGCPPIPVVNGPKTNWITTFRNFLQ